MYLTKLFIVATLFLSACKTTHFQQAIDIIGLNNNYSNSDILQISIKSNMKERIYFHLEGDSFSKEFQWGEFTNNLMSGSNSKSEKNYWLEPGGEYKIEIPIKRFTQQFMNNQDSFRFEIVYYYEGQTNRNSIFSTSFTIKK